MAGRDLTPEELQIVELLLQLQALSPEGATTAARLIVLLPDGTYMGDAVLNLDAVQRLSEATFTLATDRTPAGHDDEDDFDGIDPLLVASMRDVYAAINPMSLLNTIADAPDPKASEKALDEMVAEIDWPGWDGEQK